MVRKSEEGRRRHRSRGYRRKGKEYDEIGLEKVNKREDSKDSWKENRRSEKDEQKNAVFNEDAKMAIRIRLNMVTWISNNVGGNDVCPLVQGNS